jgi:pre-rRNA-processing protein TSR2
MSSLLTLVPIIRSVFSRWTALQLAVTHSMGGPTSEAKYEAFIEALGRYLIRSIRSSSSTSATEQDIQEYLDEIMDEEFNTVLDDGSSLELAQLFVRYIQLIQQGKLVDIQQELQLQNSTAPSIQMSVRNKNEDDSTSSSDNDEGDETGMNDEKSSNEPKPQAMDVDEDEWVTVHRRGKGKK